MKVICDLAGVGMTLKCGQGGIPSLGLPPWPSDVYLANPSTAPLLELSAHWGPSGQGPGREAL